MNHLILGGTGTVGGAVVRELLAKGEAVRVLSRSEEKVEALPKGAAGVVGDLTDPLTYERIFKGSDSLFLVIANSITETYEGLAALHEAKKHGYKKIVYLSVQNPEDGFHIAHLGAKWVIEEAIRQSGIPFTILQPSNFYQNDYWFKDAILQHSIYRSRWGISVSRESMFEISPKLRSIA